MTDLKDIKPLAIICDIDGTLAHMCDRSPYDYSKVDGDTVNEPVADILRQYKGDIFVIIVSGREATCQKETEKWLKDKGISYHRLYMRKIDDNRGDQIVKKEIFDKHIKDKYKILFVLDDRDRVVKMWREELGLTCLQVAYGDF